MFIYPETRRDENAIDNYHGTSVPDPYRWLEDPDSAETKQWVEAENKVTDAFLAQCDYRAPLKKRFEETYNYVKMGCPFRRGDKGMYFFYKNDGLQNQAVLYKQKSLQDKAEVLLDPNTLSSDGTASLGSVSFSRNAQYMEYGLCKKGSDWQTIHILNVETGEHLTETLEWCKFASITWAHDNQGFFYTSYPVPESLKNKHEDARGAEVEANANQTIYYHRIGTSQSQDRTIFATPANPKWMFGVTVTTDGEYLLIYVSEDCNPVNRLYYVKMNNIHETDENGHVKVVKLIDNFDAEYSYITNQGTIFYFKTNLKSPKNKVISIDFSSQTVEPKEVIPETEDVLEDATCVNKDYLILIYSHNVQSEIRLHTLAGKYLKHIQLPGIGDIPSLTGREEDDEFLFSFTSFLTPSIIYRYSFADDSLSTFFQTVVGGINPENFETKQVWFTSKDGTKVPMFIVHKKGLELNGNNPTLMYGYGGFSIPLKSSFSIFVLNFIHHFNAVYAVPNLRGGAEFGEEWHQAGTKERKQNVFDDFHSAAEFLIQNKYTNSSKLAIRGGSNGGLLVGATVNQRPELFAAANAAVGVMDMLKFHKFTIGYAWTSDYGSSDDATGFQYLYKYSPLHNIRVNSSQYPAMLVTTSDHDDRVVPLHSFKYIAELQHVIGRDPKQTNPLLIRIEVNAGHGAGKPTSKIIEELADVYGFFAKCLGAKWHD